MTARAAYKPVRQFFKDIGYDVYVVALSSSNPKDKSDWIEKQIKNGYDDVLFFDDSKKNIVAVKKLKNTYPDIKLITRLVNYD